MKPQLLKVGKNESQSFSVRKEAVNKFFNKWHYHPEFEISYIVKGRGLRFIGDNIERFKEEDLILVGENLPHFWNSDDGLDMLCESIVVHFNKDCFGEKFMKLPEMTLVNEILERSKSGMLISGKTSQSVAKKMRLIYKKKGEAESLILLLNILSEISVSNDIRILSVNDFEYKFHKEDESRINKIYNYTFKNYANKIDLREISEVASISSKSFCRYFKQKTRKTYTDFLQEIRISNACKLLIQNNFKTTHIANESGFINISNFNKAFKKTTGLTPLEYKKKYILNDLSNDKTA